MVTTRTQAIIHTDRLKRNVERIRRYASPGADFIAVLKGDAYGCGIPGVYSVLRECGVHSYAVAISAEGTALRQAGAEDEEILILGDTWDDQLPDVIRDRLIPTVFAFETAEKLSALALQAGMVQRVEIKIDTGMSRIGIPAGPGAAEEISRIARLPGICIHGAFTHFVSADDTEDDLTDRQFKAFIDTVEAARALGVSFPRLHTANSAATVLRPGTHLDGVRAGDILYGLKALDEPLWSETGFEEVLTWESYVALVKTIQPGSTVGYGATFKAQRPTVIATIPVGFADGYSRKLSNKGIVCINGKPAPIVGRVCMDQMMADVTGIEGVERGSRVELLGEGFGIADMADMLDVNVDEIVCGISKRVPRIYK